MNRALLPPRRDADAIRFEDGNGHVFRIHVGFYPSGGIGEVFINAEKTDSSLDALAGDTAILLSLLLQHGATFKAIGHALRRNPSGSRASFIGEVVDHLELLYGTHQVSMAGLSIALTDPRIDAIYQHLKLTGHLVPKEALCRALCVALGSTQP
jgi:hypothetical protein